MYRIIKSLKILIFICGIVFLINVFGGKPLRNLSDEEVHDTLTGIMNKDNLGYDKMFIDREKKHSKSKIKSYLDIILYDEDRMVKTAFTIVEETTHAIGGGYKSKEYVTDIKTTGLSQADRGSYDKEAIKRYAQKLKNALSDYDERKALKLLMP